MSIKSNSTMGFQLYLELNESEARALLALTRYGSKSFLEVFYKSLGQTELKDDENGLISLFETVKTEMPKHISRIDATRNVFQVNNPNQA